PPLIASVSQTDEMGNQSSVSYTYDTFGNIKDLAENDFGGTTLRHTITTFMGAPYTTNHILSLPSSIQVKDGNNTLKNRTDFNYDQTTLLSRGQVTGNDNSIQTPRGNLTSVSRYLNG